MTTQLNNLDAFPTDKELVLKVIPMPKDCNAAGHIFGGWVMAQVDLAGSVLPHQHCHSRIVTVAIKEFIFKQPVQVGDLLSFFAKITTIGRTSLTVEVDVFAQGRSFTSNTVKVAQATLKYVSLDDHGRPYPVPPLAESTLTNG